MNPPVPSADFEVCPSCSQRTATRFFRTVGKRRLCLLCAKRAEDTDASARAQIEDHHLHGGAGWLWKHIGSTASAAVGGVILRMVILHYLRGH